MGESPGIVGRAYGTRSHFVTGTILVPPYLVVRAVFRLLRR